MSLTYTSLNSLCRADSVELETIDILSLDNIEHILQRLLRVSNLCNGDFTCREMDSVFGSDNAGDLRVRPHCEGERVLSLSGPRCAWASITYAHSTCWQVSSIDNFNSYTPDDWFFSLTTDKTIVVIGAVHSVDEGRCRSSSTASGR